MNKKFMSDIGKIAFYFAIQSVMYLKQFLGLKDHNISEMSQKIIQ